MSANDYYNTLQVARSATQDEISAAYRKLARKYHPDVCKAPDAERRFKELGEAYAVLRDPEKRALYDQFGPSWEAVGRVDPSREPDIRSSGFSVNMGDLGDMGAVFEQFFGRASGRARGAGWPDAERGVDLESHLQLSVEQAFRGGRQRIEVPALDGSGNSRTLNVKIPPGVQPGQRIRLAGQGSTAASGSQTGDLILRVQIRDSERFRLEGDDVIAAFKLQPWQAALGASIAFQTLDSEVRLSVPAGTSSGRRFRMRGKGYPDATGKRGDLYAEACVVVPTSLSAEQRELYARLATLDGASEGQSSAA